MKQIFEQVACFRVWLCQCCSFEWVDVGIVDVEMLDVDILVLGFGCLEICSKCGECSQIFKAGNYLGLF